MAESKSVPEIASELWDLTKTYAKQQTIDPLRAVPRFLGLGMAGAVCWGIGLVLVLLALLRFLQTETGTSFTGNLSWIPYLITLVVGVLLIILGVSRISKRKGITP